MALRHRHRRLILCLQPLHFTISSETPIPEGTKFEKYDRNASKQSINIYQQKIDWINPLRRDHYTLRRLTCSCPTQYIHDESIQ